MAFDMSSIDNNKNNLNNNSTKEDNLIGYWPIEEMYEISISEMKILPEFSYIRDNSSIPMNITKMGNISKCWEDNNRCKKYISNNNWIANNINRELCYGYVYADSWQPYNNKGQPCNEEPENPWSFYNHNSLFPFFNQSIDEFSFWTNSKWFEEPAINTMKWYHNMNN